ncbi:MAG: flagellar basal body-associated FliL family protein [Pseudomonadota bacterium]
MAADKKGAKPSEEEAAVATATTDSAEAKKKKKKILLLIGLAFLLVAISIGATVGVIKLISAKDEPAVEAANDEVDEEEDEVKKSDTKKTKSVAAKTKVAAVEPLLPAIYLALKPNFTVNFDVNGRQRFLQAELTVMYRDIEVLKILELHMPAVRNGLVLLLSNQAFDDLQTVEGKEKLRASALKIVQDILIKEQLDAVEKPVKEKNKLPNIEQILFTNFVMQ